ncbi:VOC family protein [Actinomadura flavalba]|uniref:VOC family protein n=1 Tax=Actinomadura flavalba TaxID=1120938 RepID=UPI000527A6DF|nr:VOC family protein [Actinomadura flavalba]
MTAPSFSGGVNIAMKIPKAEFEATVAFYRDVLRFDVVPDETGTRDVSRTYRVQYGPTTLWLDCVDHYARPDLWLDLRTDDLARATAHLAAAGVATCDEIEDLGDAPAHWIKNPAGLVHLLAEHPAEQAVPLEPPEDAAAAPA